MKSKKTWTLMEILKWSVDYLHSKNVEDARACTEWLLCDVLSCSRMDLYLQHDRPMSDSELDRYRPLLLKCAAHQPIQQLLSSCEFYGLKLALNDKVLIPRPETELLVDLCIKEALALTEEKAQNLGSKEQEEKQEAADAEPQPFVFKPTLHILDIGAGSGCISVALAKHIPNAEIYALEKSQAAIEVIQRNVHFHNLEKRVHILQEDIFEYIPQRRFDIIVSNPPYIAAEEMSGLSKKVSHFEPYMALSDAADGLTFYRYFSEKFSKWLTPAGIALLEFGANAQTAALKDIFSAFEVQVTKDYQQDDRIMLLKNKKEAEDDSEL